MVVITQNMRVRGKLTPMESKILKTISEYTPESPAVVEKAYRITGSFDKVIFFIDCAAVFNTSVDQILLNIKF